MLCFITVLKPFLWYKKKIVQCSLIFITFGTFSHWIVEMILNAWIVKHRFQEQFKWTFRKWRIGLDMCVNEIVFPIVTGPRSLLFNFYFCVVSPPLINTHTFCLYPEKNPNSDILYFLRLRRGQWAVAFWEGEDENLTKAWWCLISEGVIEMKLGWYLWCQSMNCLVWKLGWLGGI